MSKFEADKLTLKNIKASIEVSNKFDDIVLPIIEQQERLKEITRPLTQIVEQYQNITSQLSAYNSVYERMSNLVKLMRNITQNFSSLPLNVAQSQLFEWIKTFDFSPLSSIIEEIKNIGFDYNCEKVNEVFLKAMFDARWFPYAGWNVDLEIVDALLEILNTSRASKNRIKKIDKLIFSYYNEDEIKNLKREWRKMCLPSYLTRILVQSIQAYYRREYALTISALSTLWEGIIQEKTKDESYRVSKRTRENLTKLIEKNEFDQIFSSFCEEFIFYDCKKADEVKQDVPGRHGIAHCWYNTYPNRKVALNAILFTDFLLRLKPLNNTEENDNG